MGGWCPRPSRIWCVCQMPAPPSSSPLTQNRRCLRSTRLTRRWSREKAPGRPLLSHASDCHGQSAPTSKALRRICPSIFIPFTNARNSQLAACLGIQMPRRVEEDTCQKVPKGCHLAPTMPCLKITTDSSYSIYLFSSMNRSHLQNTWLTKDFPEVSFSNKWND